MSAESAWAPCTAESAPGDQVRIRPCAQADQYGQRDYGQPARQMGQQPGCQQADQPEGREVKPDDVDATAGHRTGARSPVVGGVQTPDTDPARRQRRCDSRVAPITQAPIKIDSRSPG